MRIAAAITTAALLLASTSASAQGMEDVEIRAVSLAPGVAVLFGNGGNIGVSHGEDGTLLIDDQFAVLSDKIKAAVADLGATPTRFLVNTHWHFDHAGGNEPFGQDGATIMAHDNVRIRLAEGGTVAGNETPPAPAAALPLVTYDRGVTLHLNGDTIDVMYLGGGHTDGDSVVHWREANVVHMGDLFMNRLGWPFIDTSSGGDVEHFINSLDQALSLMDDETTVIPGHGAIATKSDLIAFRTMIATAVDRIKAQRDAGASVEQAIAADIVSELRNAPEGFVSDAQFVIAVYASLDAHVH